MNKKSALKIFVYVVYIILIVLCLTFAKYRDHVNSNECENFSCVRFCSSFHEATLSNETSSMELKDPVTNETQTFHLFHGKPCETMKLLDTDRWKFSSVSFREKFWCRVKMRVRLCFNFKRFTERIYFCGKHYLLILWILSCNSRRISRWEWHWESMESDGLRRPIQTL